MIEGRARFVAIANGSYVVSVPLEQAVPDAESLAKILRGQQYETAVLRNLERGELFDEIDKELGKDALANGTLIVVWIGHGIVGPGNELRLLARSKSDDFEIEAAKLGEWAVRTGARTILIVIDTCFSGAGLADAAKLADAVNGGRASPEKTWFGILAASLKDETARSGALVRELKRILAEGPRKADFRWNKNHHYIRGDDLLQALLADWSELRQKPHQFSVGRAWDLVCNPCFKPGLSDEPVEHLLFAARGGAGEENYFTGREHVLSEIVQWLRADAPGLFVLTGPPGCGKSAIAGRIVSLSSSAERSRLQEMASIPLQLDPGAGSVDGQLHARSHTIESASEELARQLGLDAGTGQFGVLGEAHRRRKGGDPLVVVVDSLDEAGAFSGNIAAELLAPLAREALVLVATRDVASGSATLISQLGPAAKVLDLGQDIEGTRQDIWNYVKRRLAEIAPNMNPELVANELAPKGRTEAPQFLLARLVTSQLREQPVDTSSEGWRLALATTVENALERDLQSIVLKIAGEPHPTAAREMLRALALAHGSGFPADDVWPAVATAISATGTVYTRDHAYEVLAALGRHLLAGSEGEQPVYRIAHQKLVDYVTGNVSTTASGVAEAETTLLVGNAIRDEYEQLLNSGLGPRAHTYLWRHAWRHLAEAGPSGLAALRALVERDRPAFLLDLAAALELAASKAYSTASPDQALALYDEAVDLRRELGDGLKLAMALFSLSFAQSTTGDLQAAGESAVEAVETARKANDSAESRSVLSAVLLARANTQLMAGQYKAALLLAKEATALIEAAGMASEKDHWSQLVAGYSVIGRAAFALEDLEKAAAVSQRAVALVDQYASAGEESDLRLSPLLILANVQIFEAALSSPDATGTFRPVVSTAAERILNEYRKVGPRGTISDIVVSGGIVYYARARILDLSRGVKVAEGDAPVPLLREAIGLVRPFADQVLEAAFSFSEGVMMLVLLQGQSVPIENIPEFAEAVRNLRHFATGGGDLAALSLGTLLDTQTAVQGSQGMRGAAGDLAAIVARQKEAVALLRKCRAWFAQRSLAEALGRLSELLRHPAVAEHDQALATRAEAIETWRNLVARYPDARLRLADLLTAQAAQLLETRTVEAEDLAREALTLAESLELAPLAAVAGTNLAAAQLVLGRHAGVREILVRAIERLEPLVQHPIFSKVLANACLNLSLVEHDASHFPEAVQLAQRALDLFDTPSTLPGAADNRPLALLALGRAQRGDGQRKLGTATLVQVINGLRAEARKNQRGVLILANALNQAAPDFWDEVVAAFADRPDLARILNLLRWRAPDEMPITVAALVSALEAPGPKELRFLRAIARQQRSRAPIEFEATWQNATGATPDWLQLSPAHECLVIAWWNAPSWKLSRDYLKSHPVLLEPDTDIVLDEFGLDEMDENLLGRHAQLLRDARVLGPDAAYAQWLAMVEATDWVRSEDWEQYLADHDELLRPEITAALREEAGKGDAVSVVFLAILDLARRGESPLAFQATKEGASIVDQLQAAWRSNDITRLASLALIVQGCTEDAAIERTATVALAIARVLEHAAEEVETLIAPALAGSTDSDREKLLAVVGDAIEHHPTSASELARLIHAISDFGKG